MKIIEKSLFLVIEVNKIIHLRSMSFGCGNNLCCVFCLNLSATPV